MRKPRGTGTGMAQFRTPEQHGCMIGALFLSLAQIDAHIQQENCTCLVSSVFVTLKSLRRKAFKDAMESRVWMDVFHSEVPPAAWDIKCWSKARA